MKNNLLVSYISGELYISDINKSQSSSLRLRLTQQPITVHTAAEQPNRWLFPIRNR